jgi:BCCT family betaine/carnitine transporter
MQINQTLYHWGLSAWGSYLTVALAQALGTYRFGLPMTFRSSFYPLLGEHTWGWLGDVLDGFTIVTTVAGICTSLGLGAFQIVAGMKRLGWLDVDLTEEQETMTQSIIVWVITLIATGSVLAGLDVGIQVCVIMTAPSISCFVAIMILSW